MPDVAAAREPANAVVIQGEDSAFDTIQPRLRALGADLDRVFVLRGDLLDEDNPFSLPSQNKLLEHALSINNPRLVIIDPITAFLDPNVPAYCDQILRR